MSEAHANEKIFLEDIFSHLGDILGNLFGRHLHQEQAGLRHGADLRVDLSIPKFRAKPDINIIFLKKFGAEYKLIQH
ncbi:hypothetical protein FJZ31_23925 [Candidatus Poribacteria bacterium]|nr:hypothetical protein [Candidatus Poribacteria bacterium]